MFAGRIRQVFIELAPDEERVYRLPPMSVGTVLIQAHQASEIKKGPKGQTVIIPEQSPVDLEMTLQHANHFSQSHPVKFLTESLWQDDLWRLRVRRKRTPNIDPAAPPDPPRTYRVEATYPSQLPILKKEIEASFFHEGFKANYNDQQYLKVVLSGRQIKIDFTQDFKDIYGLEEIVLDAGRLEFKNSVAMTDLRLDIGAGPLPGSGHIVPFISARAEFPAVEVEVHIPADNPEKKLEQLVAIVKLYLTGSSAGHLGYIAEVRSNLLNALNIDVSFPDPGEGVKTVNIKDEMKKIIETGLNNLQAQPGARPGLELLTSWLVGGLHEMFGVGYVSGPDDKVNSDGTIKSATGKLALSYVGPRIKPKEEPALTTDPLPPPPDDGSKTATLTVVADDGTNRLAVIANGDGTSLATKAKKNDPEAVFTVDKSQSFTLSVPAVSGRLVFDSWSDGRRRPSRTVSLGTKTTLTATYLQRLFDVPDEDPDPVVTSGGVSPIGGGGVTPIGIGGVHPPQPGGKQSIGALAKIDHIVVLMQENRSFDQVLGYLSRDKINPEVDGLLPPDHPQHQTQVNRFKGRNFFPQKADKDDPRRPDPRKATATAWPSFAIPGPCHDEACVHNQMEDNMGRFVADFANRVGEDSPNLRLVMDYFDGEQLQVYNWLQREFGICDRWYTAHAGPTWPNRFVLLTGDLNKNRFGEIEADNPDRRTMIPVQTPTLFDHLNDRGVSWRVFEHGISFTRLFRNFTFDTENIVPFNDPVRGFEAAARNGELPSVTLIEPDYIDLPPGNDDHPPADMADGQDLVKRIVQALIGSPTWERTLLIITYDEHGGFYDHKQPPNGDDVPPLLGNRRQLGPRVPTFLVSPLIAQGAVFHSRFDHTSIGTTILRRFCGGRPPRVSPRLDTARDLREVLTLTEPRKTADIDLSSLPKLPTRPATQKSAPARGQRIGFPNTQKDDFHWLLSSVRLTTGQPPKVSNLRKRAPQKTSGELLYFRDKARNGTGDVATPSVIGLGGWQNFKHVFSGGNGSIYAVNQDGKLLLYRDKTQDGTGDVANPSVIGLGGWQNFKFLFSGGNRIIYAVDQAGRLLFYRDTTQDGIGDVANPSIIGQSGWQNFRQVFSGGDGIIYAVDAAGRLLFHRDSTQNGTGNVAAPSVIGLGGWQNFKHVFSGGTGIIYAIDQAGRLLFYRDKTQNGTGDVANPAVIGQSGWQNFKHVSSGGNGIIYAVVS